MASTAFTDGITVVLSSWLNDVNSATYTNFGDGTNYTGNLTVGSSKFVVTAASGNLTINTNKFTVAGASGNTLIAGTLALTSDFAIATSKFTVASASGNTLVAGTLNVTGSVAVNTNKFTVDQATGAVMSNSLAGVGTRHVVVDASGNMSAP